MTPALQPKQLLRRLGSGPSEVEGADAATARRAKVVAHLGVLMRTEPERRREIDAWRRRAAMVALVATVALVVGGAWVLRGSSPGPVSDISTADALTPNVAAVAGRVSVSRPGQELRAAGQRAMTLELSDEVRTGPAGEARIILESGAVVQVSKDTRVSLSDSAGGVGRRDEQIEVDRGRVDVAVPPLGNERALSVATPHARVVVHGTRFSVEVGRSSTGGVLFTAVEVSEGAVVVHAAGRESRLGPGSSWSSEAQRLAGHAPDQDRVGPEPTALGEPESGAAARPVASAAATTPPSSSAVTAPDAQSTLAEQNRLFASALDARRRGNNRAVVARLDELIRRFPDSALLPEVQLERSRALERLSRSGGGANGDGDR